MISFLKRLRSDKRGNVLLIASAAFPLLVGAAGLATDTIQWTLWKRELQRAADSAALAGVYQRVHSEDLTGVESAVARDLSINNHANVGLLTTYPKVDLPADSGVFQDQVHVQLALKKRLVFSSMFMSTPPTITANATAASVPAAGDPCVFATETSASQTGVNITGNAGIDMPDCVIHSNSPSSNSAAAGGSSNVNAEAVSAVGGVQQSNNWHVGSYRPYSPPLPDPFANVTPSPSDMKCAVEATTKHGVTTYTPLALDEHTDVANAVDMYGNPANCFTSLSIGASAATTLPAGTYYINGGDAFIQGDISCTGCTIVLTNSDPASTTIGKFKVNSGSKINLTAPSTGDFKGIAVYQDRRATDSSPGNKINGNSGSVISGALYFPKQELDYNGSGNTTAVCTMFVARRVYFSGNSATTNKFKKLSDCSAFGLPSGGVIRMVRLVA